MVKFSESELRTSFRILLKPQKDLQNNIEALFYFKTVFMMHNKYTSNYLLPIFVVILYLSYLVKTEGDEKNLMFKSLDLKKYILLAPKRYKRSVVSGFIYRIHRACSSWLLFHESLEKAKRVLERNQYLSAFYERFIKTILVQFY